MRASEKTKSSIEELIEILKKERPDLYLASRYATKEDRINALYKLMKRGEIYHPKKLAEEWQKTYGIPISRVAVSHYLAILGSTGRVEYRGRGAHGRNLYRKP